MVRLGPKRRPERFLLYAGKIFGDHLQPSLFYIGRVKVKDANATGSSSGRDKKEAQPFQHRIAEGEGGEENSAG